MNWRGKIAAVLSVALVGSAMGYGINNSISNKKGFVFPPYSVTTTTTTGGGSLAFVAGTCSPACTANATPTSATVSTTDTDTGTFCSPGACGTSTSKTATFYIDKPNNLDLTNHQAPAVIIMQCGLFNDTGIGGGAWGGTQGQNPGWANEAALQGFVVLIYKGIASEGCGQRAFSSTAIQWNNGVNGTTFTCGTGSSVCDVAPQIVSLLNSVECPIANGGNCLNINPNEVFMQGDSAEGVATMGVACDTRSGPMLAGVSIVSDTMIGTNTSSGSPATLANAAPPNCPTILGFTNPFGQSCWWDCVSGLNPQVSFQWIYGLSDSLFGSNALTNGITYSGDSKSWVYGIPDLAVNSTKGIGAQLGCPTTATATTTGLGQTGKITVKTYAGCSNSTYAAQTAVQIVSISGAGHIPDTYCTNVTGTSIVCSSGTQTGASDGLFDPAAAWNFWMTYFK